MLELKGIKFSQVIFCISGLFLFLLSSRTIKKWPCSCEINLYLVAVPAITLEPGHPFPGTVVGRQRLSCSYESLISVGKESGCRT